MNDVSILMLTFSLYIEQSNGFFARTIRDGNWRTRTHLDITAAGTFRAIEKYIKFNKRPGSGSIEDFFKNDPNGKDTMMKKVFALRKAVADTQENKKDTAYIHCHADQIDLAHNFVKSCKQKLIARQNDRDELITQLGECLYTIQSFYSNTNWVEMYGGVVYDDFGINDLMEVATLEEDTCLDNAEYNTGCKNNIRVNGKLTSGYHHGRGNTKPLKAVGSSTGKCSHGGPDDESRKIVARCGINKDSLTPEWSPHYHLHEQAYTAAIQATENFIVAHVRHERSASPLSFSQQIAEATGEKVHETDKESIGNVLDTVIGETFPSTEIIIESFDWSASETINKNITIDSTITVLKISVTGSSAETDVDLYYANGTLEIYTSGKSTRIYTSSGETIISIQHPPCSIMNLRRNVINDWKVKITSQSSIKVYGELLEKSDIGEMVSLKGSPISDNNYTVELFVYSLGLNGTCHTIALTDSTGNVISSHEASQLQRDFDTLCAATFRMPYVEFQVKLYGNDDRGRPFTRKLSEIHKPCSVELSIKASTDDVILGKIRLIGYEIKNRGTVTETYHVSISDDHSFVKGTTTVQYTLRPGESSNGTFAVKPTTPSVIFSYTISVLIVSTGKIQQSITKKLVVTDVERPDCTVIHTDGVCGISSLNTANCTLYPWTALAEVTFSGTLLDSISSTVGTSVKMAHVNITGLSTGTIAVNIGGDCCTPSLSIHVIDVDGFISQCDLSFADGQSVQTEYVVSETSGSSGTDIYTIIIIMTVCVAVVVVAVIIAFVLRMDQIKSKDALARSKVITDTSTNEKFNKGLAIIEQ